MKNENRELIVGLDVGSQNIRVLVAAPGEAGTFEVIGLGDVASAGIRRGVVVNMEEAVASIRTAIEEAEATSEVRISDVNLSIGGGRVRGINVWGRTPIGGSDITASDIEAVGESVQAAAQNRVEENERIIHFITQEYVIDGIGEIREPKGMNGTDLGVKAHVVTASNSAVENLLRCVQRAGLEISSVTLAPIAAAERSLTPDERELGAVFIGIGAGTIGVAVFRGGVVRHSAVLPIGGNEITTDIMAALHISNQEAEYLKCESGCAMASLADDEAEVEIPAAPGAQTDESRRVRARELAQFIEPRVEELLEFVQKNLEEAEISRSMCPAGVVLAGGAALMPGMAELAADLLGMQVRIGTPLYEGQNASILRNKPELATVLGLVAQAQTQRIIKDKGQRPSFFKRMGAQFKNWLSNTF